MLCWFVLKLGDNKTFFSAQRIIYREEEIRDKKKKTGNKEALLLTSQYAFGKVISILGLVFFYFYSMEVGLDKWFFKPYSGVLQPFNLNFISEYIFIQL